MAWGCNLGYFGVQVHTRSAFPPMSDSCSLACSSQMLARTLSEKPAGPARPAGQDILVYHLGNLATGSPRFEGGCAQDVHTGTGALGHTE